MALLCIDVRLDSWHYFTLFTCELQGDSNDCLCWCQTQAFFQIGHSIPPPIPNSLSSDAQDFIRQCLRVVPDDRPSASKLLAHPFVRRAVPASVGFGSSSNSDAKA